MPYPLSRPWSILAATPFVASLAAGCGDPVRGEGAAAGGVVTDGADALTRADAALRGSAGGLELELATAGVARRGFRIRGRTQAPVTTAFAFVPDDEVGSTSSQAKSFLTTLPAEAAAHAASGFPLFFSLATSDGRAAHARVELRFGAASKAAGPITFDRSFTSYVAGGRSVVRVTGRFVKTLREASGTFLGPDPKPRWAGTTSGDRFAIDMPLSLVTAAALSRQPLAVLVTDDRDDFSGELVPELTVTKLALTTKDAYDTWPAPSCTPRLERCLARAGDDTSPCGPADVVRACGARPGPSLCGGALEESLTNEAAGLLYTSESDYPFEAVTFPGQSLLAERGVEGDADAFRAVLGVASDTPVRTQTVDELFAWASRELPEMGPEARFRAARFRELAATVKRLLPDARVFRVGAIEVQVYVVGSTACGELAGLRTISIET